MLKHDGLGVAHQRHQSCEAKTLWFGKVVCLCRVLVN